MPLPQPLSASVPLDRAVYLHEPTRDFPKGSEVLCVEAFPNDVPAGVAKYFTEQSWPLDLPEMRLPSLTPWPLRIALIHATPPW